MPARLPTIRQIRCALAALDTGGIAAAARQLGRAPATVSAQVTALEEGLGTRLLDRRAQGLVPTQAGRQFERVARRIMDDLAAALGNVMADRATTSSPCAIGLVMAPPGSPARDAVTEAAQQLPGRRGGQPILAMSVNAGVPPPQGGFMLDATDRPARGLAEHWVLAGLAEATEAVVLPELPPPLLRGGLREAARAGLEAAPIALPPDRLDTLPRLRRQAILLPSLLLPGWLRDGKTPLRLLTPRPNGPGWALRASAEAESDGNTEVMRKALEQAFKRRIGRGALDAPLVSGWTIAPEREHLECFDAAWRHASLTRAARELGIAQPAATLRLRALEQGLGRPLFTRHPHGLTPTPSGRLLAPAVTAFVKDLGRLSAGLARPRDQVRAGCVPAIDEMSMLAEAVARSVADWNQRFPHRRLHLVEALSEDLRRMVLNDDIDCAFVDNDALQPGLVVRSIMREPLVAVSAEGHGGLPAGAIRFATLSSHPLVLPSPHHGLRWSVDRTAVQAGVELLPSAEIDSLASTIRLVKNGGWVTLLPLGALRGALRLGGLQVNAVVEPTVERQISIIRRHGEALPEDVLALVDIFSAHLQSLSKLA